MGSDLKIFESEVSKLPFEFLKKIIFFVSFELIKEKYF